MWTSIRCAIIQSFKSQNEKTQPLIETDRLSNLPEDLKEKILTYLPIKEAGRTSILSTKWRYTWASIPELSFRDNTIVWNRDNGIEMLVRFVDTVFSLHKGSIRKFSLSTFKACFEAFDRWILKLSKIRIEDLTLDLSWRYEIHSSLFSFDALNNLNLKCCLVKLPDQFKGFKLVQTLTLESLEISGDDLEKLVSICPLLKKLGIHYLPRHIILNVHAKNLESLQIAGKCSDIHIHAPKLESLEFIRCAYSYLELNAPKLRSIKINARGCESRRDERNFGQFLDYVPDLEYLELEGVFLEYLSSASWLKESLLIFNCLKYVKLELFYLMETDVPFVLGLLQRAPHLESLDIKCLSFRLTNGPWETVDSRESWFEKLKTVNIIIDYGPINCIAPFVKHILLSAPQLVILTMKEKYSKYKGDEKMRFDQFMRFPRVSSKAQIVIE